MTKTKTRRTIVRRPRRKAPAAPGRAKTPSALRYSAQVFLASKQTWGPSRKVPSDYPTAQEARRAVRRHGSYSCVYRIVSHSEIVVVGEAFDQCDA
jgi:hypothetical protein